MLVLTSRVRTKRIGTVDDVVFMLRYSLRKMLTKQMPFKTRELIIRTPVKEDCLRIQFKHPIRAKAYVKPWFTSSAVSILLYATSVKVSGLEFYVSDGYMKSVKYSWVARRKPYLPNYLDAKEGLYFLAYPPILEYLKSGSVEVRSSYSETARFFRKFVESLLTVHRSSIFRRIDPRKLLNTKTPLSTLNVAYYPSQRVTI